MILSPECEAIILRAACTSGFFFLGSCHPAKIPQAHHGNRREAYVCGCAHGTVGGIQTAEGSGMTFRSDLAALLVLAFVAAAIIGHWL
jgi:hypothetical protein